MAEHVFHRPRGRRQRLLEAAARASAGVAHWLRKGRRHSIGRDRAAISHHYDQPVEFYRPWLGESLVYSCAYFRRPDDDLRTAQTNKLEHICRKLGLGRDDRFLDVGCGWGSPCCTLRPIMASMQKGSLLAASRLPSGPSALLRRR